MVNQAANYYIGLMSGTSADGVEAALVEIDASRIQFRHACYNRFEPTLCHEIQALARGEYGEHDPIELLGGLDVRLGEAFARTALQVIAEAGVDPRTVRAIGSHGQTIRHRPDASPPFTLQIGDPNIIAARTGLTTVADFRRRDMALGGQGAPLSPAFHQAAFGSRNESRAVLNLGGIANLTLLDRGRKVCGFDTGPANTLLDAWATRHGHGPFDRNGALARSGHSSETLLTALLDDGYFRRPPPKSTGPEHFNLDWLDAAIDTSGETLATEEVQATLVELTAHTVARGLRDYAAPTRRVYVCGGGIHNPALMQALSAAMTGQWRSTADLGIDPDYVEAMAFAWLAQRTLDGQSGNLPSVTGSRRTAVLGTVSAGD